MLHVRVSEVALELVRQVAEQLDIPQARVVDCLIRGLSDREIAAVVRARAASDEDARAAWYRAAT